MSKQRMMLRKTERESTETVFHPALTRSVPGFAVQPKLTVNTPGDSFEREADSVANSVMRTPDSAFAPVQRQGEEALSRKESGRVSGGSPDVAGVVSQGLSGGGQSLDSQTRSFMEPRFGHDFSQVKVHTDSQASQSAEAVAARAYTVGGDIAFRSGQYEPGTSEGKRLLAHELTHVVQQGAAGKTNDTAMRSPDPANEGLVSASASPHQVQRAVDTDGGSWDTTNYAAYNEGPEVGKRLGADIWVTFAPKAPVEADQIGLIQSVKTLKSTSAGGDVDTPSLLGRKSKTALTDKEGDKGRAIDQTDTNTSPLYAVENKGGAVAKTLTDVGADASYGAHGYRKKQADGSFDVQNAALGDAPRRSREFAGQGWEHSFEVAALVLSGALANTYLGSIAWGWHTDATGAAVLDPNPIKLVRAGNPTAAFMAAGDKWNNTKIALGGKDEDAVKMPTFTSMTTRQLLARIDTLTTQLTGGADPAKAAEKADLEAELATRNINAQVSVATKRGRVFDDKVSLKMTRPNGTVMETPTYKMDSGDVRTFAVPVASFLPLTGKIGVEAWDHNLLSEDVRILAQDWNAPFTSATLSGGVGKALYNVNMSFDK